MREDVWMRRVKFRCRFFILLIFIFILIVSIVILAPEISENGIYREIRDNQDYVAVETPDNNENSWIRQAPRLNLTDAEKTEIIENYYEKFKLDFNYVLTESPWKLAESWVKPREIHPEYTPELGMILNEMSTGRILEADVGHGGTQLKLSLVLRGGQKVAFKPKWYDRDFVVLGKPYDGADRHNAEIAAFHLNRILGLRRAPLVVGRRINLKTEILPVAKKRLSDTFFTRDEQNLCFYGKCLYCKSESDGVCAKGHVLEGIVILWLPSNYKLQNHRSPWQRTYRDDRKARWENNDRYCDWIKSLPLFNQGPRLLDLIDGAVLDYLIGNADRHHYETMKNFTNSAVLLLDNAKSFGNPFHDEQTILAPIYQCCIIRRKTYEQLLKFTDGLLSSLIRRILADDPISPILTDLHLKALDRRLNMLLSTIQQCIQLNGAEENVLVGDDENL
ncbi:glycosaminoglycan xylosylkinase-like [Tubulanus polymorphus]|uniref:glycosaminoglycan xylosylkinase-like n=1 Tax=Tubulanus polymorphus TaxID=672921 RepID=UPI003DA3A488